MITRFSLHRLWDDLASSLWFRPLLMSIAAAALASASVALDHAVTPPKFLATSPDNARALLSAIASSMITVTTLTFSIIMVALVLASQQFSPRILRNFMRDGTSQNVIGLFISTLIYSLIALNQIEERFESNFVPGVTVGMCLVLAFLSIGVFIYFIHHIAKSIQLNHIADAISSEVEVMIEAIYGTTTRPISAEKPTSAPATSTEIVACPRSGYIQAVDIQALVKWAKQYKALVVLERKLGEFVIKDTPLLHVQFEGNDNPYAIQILKSMFDIGKERTLYQDVLFGIRQLEDIAVKACSAAINDPTTAVNCLDHISQILVKLAHYPDLSPYYYDDEGHLRAIIHQVTFEDFVENGFNQIRQYGMNDVAVTLRMLEVLAEIGLTTHDFERREVLWAHGQMIGRGADKKIHEPYDRNKINRRLERLAAILEKPAFLLTDPGLQREAG